MLWTLGYMCFFKLVFFYFWYIPKEWNFWAIVVVLFLVFFEETPNCFSIVTGSIYMSPTVYKGALSPYPHQCLLFVDFFLIKAILTGVDIFLCFLFCTFSLKCWSTFFILLISVYSLENIYSNLLSICPFVRLFVTELCVLSIYSRYLPIIGFTDRLSLYSVWVSLVAQQKRKSPGNAGRDLRFDPWAWRTLIARQLSPVFLS